MKVCFKRWDLSYLSKASEKIFKTANKSKTLFNIQLVSCIDISQVHLNTYRSLSSLTPVFSKIQKMFTCCCSNNEIEWEQMFASEKDEKTTMTKILKSSSCFAHISGSFKFVLKTAQSEWTSFSNLSGLHILYILITSITICRTILYCSFNTLSKMIKRNKSKNNG